PRSDDVFHGPATARRGSGLWTVELRARLRDASTALRPRRGDLARAESRNVRRPGAGGRSRGAAATQESSDGDAGFRLERERFPLAPGGGPSLLADRRRPDDRDRR